MSAWENERKRRFDEILELLERNPDGLTVQTIAQTTKMLTEITRPRLIQYLEDLEWSGLVVKKRDGRIKLK